MYSVTCEGQWSEDGVLVSFRQLKINRKELMDEKIPLPLFASLAVRADH